MWTKLRLVLTITILFLSYSGFAQTGYWKHEVTSKAPLAPSLKGLDSREIQFFRLEEQAIFNVLATVSSSKGIRNIVYFPDQKGKLVPFSVAETPVFSPGLSAKYPSIKSYSGVSMDKRGDRIRFSVSPKGIQSMIVHSDSQKATFMQQSSEGGNQYVLYNRELQLDTDTEFICYTEAGIQQSKTPGTAKLADDQTLRTFRIAISASGEYTQFHGGTVADALAAINATLTRVNEVFERDLAVTLELVPDTDAVIFTNPAADPYSGNLNTQVQNTLTTAIGEANYDVGHLFHEDNDGGNAGFIGSVCQDNQKGSAYSAALNPVGDVFDLDFVAHELGHQFGANHTWSFESEGTDVQFEPASGTTIMGYAGIVDGNNVAPNGDDYFHYISIQQISDYLDTTNCAQETPLSDTPPTITPIGNFIIPKSTAFVLNGIASDSDAGDVLTYTWEQIDNGVVTSGTFGPQNPSGANFRSQKPSLSPDRYFPKLEEVIKGNLTQVNPPVNSAWETVSDVERDLNFAFTVRDNAPGGGQVVSDEVLVTVLNSSGPFMVTSQDTPVTYDTGSNQTITWDVGNTDIQPINAMRVTLLLSTDGGVTFPIILAQDVPNDGEQEILIPAIPTSTARIMVEASDNIFFAVNAADFIIAQSPFVMDFATLTFNVCQPENLVVPFTYNSFGGFNEAVSFSVTGSPPGLGVAISPTSASADNTAVNITLSNTSGVAAGSYPVKVIGTAASVTKEVDIVIEIFNTSFPPVALSSPADGAVEVSLNQALLWDANISYTGYDIQIARDAGFNTIIETASVISNTYVPVNLLEETRYFWRVMPKNDCGQGSFGPPFSFTTIALNCKSIVAGDTPLTISSTGTPTIVSSISYVNDLVVSDVNVILELDHTFLSDLYISLTSPSGTTVVLAANSCGDLQNIDATFDDDGSDFSCGGNPGISGRMRPLGSLASLNGESTLGDWVLEVRDTAPADGGILRGFTLEICVEGIFRPDDDNDGVFDDGDDLCLNTPPGTQVDTNGCPVFKFDPANFTLAIESESCRESNNGSLVLTAAQSLDYSVTIEGAGVNTTASFTNSYSLNNLNAGTYTACITGSDGTNDFEEICFEAIITQPDPLSVTSVLSPDGAEVTLTLTGSDYYNVEWNGTPMIVIGPEITLTAKNGTNSLKVSTDLPCQGVYEEQIFHSDRPILYPNPFINVTQIFLGRELVELQVTLHDGNGRLVSQETMHLHGTEATLDLTGLQSGLYFVSIIGKDVKATFKVIKR